jgi:probable addiction module antidote protein
MMALHTEPFDVADYLTDEETISAYLTEVLESDDPRYIAKALGAVARARNRMTQL